MTERWQDEPWAKDMWWSGKHRIIEVVPKERTIFPVACKFA